MKSFARSLLPFVSTAALAHPGHGQAGWIHKHTDELIDAAMILGACLVAAIIVRMFWKVLARP